MDVAYFPGCSLHSSSALYDAQCKSVLGKLDVALREIADWNCCGATSAAKVDDFLAIALPARNLGIADATGLAEIMIPCSSCYSRTLVAKERLAADPALAAEINAEIGEKVTGKIKVSTGVLYVAAQLIGAVLAVLLLKTIVAGPMEGGLGAHGLNVFDPQVGGGILDDQIADGAGAGLLLEMALTFALVFVVFATAMDPKGPGHLAPAAIGLVIMLDHFVGIPMTGASMNPARSFGPAVVANVWTDHWGFWLGPIIGGAIAALVYENVFMHREE